MAIKKPAAENSETYTAANLQQLDPIDHIRKRIGMYLGDSGSIGMTHGLVELIDNGIDEALGGYAKKVAVFFHLDGSVEVQDDGRGIPVDINKASGKNGIHLALGTVNASGKFGQGNSSYKTSAGLNGVGATATNSTSKRFDVTVYRDGKQYSLSFKEGKPGRFAKPNDPDSAFTPNDKLVEVTDPRTLKQKKERVRGTTVRYWTDPTIFAHDSVWNTALIIDKMKAAASLITNLETHIVNEFAEDEDKREYTFKFEGGLVDMLENISTDEALSPAVHFMDEGNFTEVVPMLNAKGKMESTEVDRVVEMDIALRWGKEYDTVLRSFVNIVDTPGGGTHVKGFERGISKAILDRIKDSKGLLKANEPMPTLDDIREGLTAIVAVKISEPQFTGQNKQILATVPANNVVYQTVIKHLGDWLDTRQNLAQAKLIYQKVINASRVRLTQKQSKETARKKTQLEGSNSMPAKLLDCAYGPDNDNELLICEGDSALAGLRPSRDSHYQALFPIRGKILNVYKATLKQVLDNAECASIIQVIGAGSGNTFDASASRYKRILFAVDADADGSHIRALLITLFAKYMRPMIDEGRLYATVPPLYQVKVGGKKNENIYVLNDVELKKVLAKLEREGRPLRGPVARFKGLGEMDPEELWDTTLNPENRALRRITWGDVAESERMLEVAMGNNVADRKEWIMGAEIDKDALDF